MSYNILILLLIFIVICSCSEKEPNSHLVKKELNDGVGSNKYSSLPYKLNDLKIKDNANTIGDKVFRETYMFFYSHKLELIDLFVSNLDNKEITIELEARIEELDESNNEIMKLPEFTIGDLCFWFIRMALAVDEANGEIKKSIANVLPYPEYLISKDKFINWWQVNKKYNIKKLQIKILKERIYLAKKEKVSKKLVGKYKEILFELEE